MWTRSVVPAALALLALPALAQPVDVVATVPPPAYGPSVGAPARRAVDLSSPPDVRGTLSDSDPRREGKPYDSHAVDLRAGDEVTVTMTATDFDTYLVVRAPSGQEWTNDDAGDTRTSQVTFNAPASGTYTVVATAYVAEGRGDYEVRVASVTATVHSTVSGRLDHEDAQQIRGEYYDEFPVRPPTDGTFYVELVPLGFAGYLRVTSPTGVHHRAEQGYDGATPIRVGPLQAERGTWTVAVTSTGASGPVGAYDVRVITMGDGQ